MRTFSKNINLLIYNNYNESGKKIIEKCVELDKLSYEAKYRGNLQLYKKLFKRNPESFIFAINNNNEVIGYMLTVCLKKDTYEKMKCGNHIDIDIINENNVLPYRDTNHLYIFSTVIHPEYKGKKLSTNMMNKLFSQIKEKETTGASVIAILGDAIAQPALRNIMKFGFAIIGQSSHGSTLVEKILSTKETQQIG